MGDKHPVSPLVIGSRKPLTWGNLVRLRGLEPRTCGLRVDEPSCGPLGSNRVWAGQGCFTVRVHAVWRGQKWVVAQSLGDIAMTSATVAMTLRLLSALPSAEWKRLPVREAFSAEFLAGRGNWFRCGTSFRPTARLRGVKIGSGAEPIFGAVATPSGAVGVDR